WPKSLNSRQTRIRLGQNHGSIRRIIFRKESVKVSLVIETDSVHPYDDIQFEDCLKAIANQSYPRTNCEFLIIDGGKIETLREVAKSILPEAKILNLPSSTKYQQKNFGIRHATGDVVGFVDADCAPPIDWIERIVNTLKSAPPEVAGIQGITQLTKG